jgi:hypothetical protein
MIPRSSIQVVVDRRPTRAMRFGLFSSVSPWTMAFSCRAAILERARFIGTATAPAETTRTSPATTLIRAGTKVIATLGNATLEAGILVELLSEGISCFRLDASCNKGVPWFKAAFESVVAASSSCRKLCAVMLDTCGPHEVTVRRDHSAPPMVIEAGAEVTLVGASAPEWSTDAPLVLPLTEGRLLSRLVAGDAVHVSRCARITVHPPTTSLSSRLAP